MSQKMTLEQELAILAPFAQEQGAEAFIDVEHDEECVYPSHIAIGFETMTQVGEEEYEPDVKVVSLSECDLDEGGEFFREAFFALHARFQMVEEQLGHAKASFNHAVWRLDTAAANALLSPEQKAAYRMAGDVVADQYRSAFAQKEPS